MAAAASGATERPVQSAHAGARMHPPFQRFAIAQPTGSSTQRLVRIAELDPSPLNRITALTGLARLASERELSLADGVAEFGPKPVLLADAPRWRDDFARLRPAPLN